MVEISGLAEISVLHDPKLWSPESTAWILTELVELDVFEEQNTLSRPDTEA